MKKFEEFNKINEEYGEPLKSELKKFIDEFINNINNPIIISMLYRMMDTGNFVKNGQTAYDLSDEEKEKLKTIIPKLDELIDKITTIKNLKI